MIIELNEITEGRIAAGHDDVAVFLPITTGETYQAGARSIVVLRDTRAGLVSFRRIHVKETNEEIKFVLQAAERAKQ